MALMELVRFGLNKYFSSLLEELDADDDTKAYIIGVLDRFKSASIDYSKDSLTTIYAAARFRQDFLIYQQLGDWLFFCNSICPEHLNSASKDYYILIGRSSYNSCYKLLNRQWKLYEQLADQFEYLSEETRSLIRENQTPLGKSETSLLI
jgi:hypothetical protein